MKEEQFVLKAEHVGKAYGDLHVLKDINLQIAKGEFVAVVGKSGCGKSTLLRLIAGLEQPTEGTITQNGEKVAGTNGRARMMFQDGRLLPWKKVIDNIDLGLTGGFKDKAMEALRSVGLEDKAKHYPQFLSGGQKQRVALARALIHEPELLLLDEPLGALDALTRMEMQNLIEEVWIKNQFTAILVTHDVEEAVRLADRVILLADGEVKMDKAISLPRPRIRTQPAFAAYTEGILGEILNPGFQQYDRRKAIGKF
ncbi:aliphatic sulfonates import ATP-binding protein SsuB 1 [Weizmannia acidilactici]|uniref:Aliphatic sulfonates import ATP-binding protein SsuB 1 n=3 Tax=Heyndrickxia TaxID=2837504 RepID=A0A5J4JKL7_9BACI|nr:MULTISPECIES: ATP-binding cassette domain-containing protein [Heyndrickxia]MED4312770.1 ATP-binding cassette domain-containing protein [Heyndrickxia coagulans]GER66798.1 aliphatic sulfonates import ATP-binding protein SsuB 1 [Weizmannia acidilactici]GER70897.1 aliphatic sulfonates import ATP-binding protein SsuB 1 [Weizmannia acidilactici]GER75061.1 aliphatic sulfonates import ATP-binding protein SsuB 1 [Weizmannia acidilactici]